MMHSADTPWDIPADWPAPTPAARAQSERLVEHLRAEIAATDGYIPFARYMELALYAPGLGYYSAGSHKIGAAGDFVTAPEISPLFARCLARSCMDVFEQIGAGDIVELGAGSGALAAELLRELARHQALPQRYRILETSADLRDRQQRLLREAVPDFFARIDWLDAPPSAAWRGVLLANEVVDALPVSVFGWSEQEVVEYGVAWSGAGFAWQARPADAVAATHLHNYAQAYAWSPGYRTEMNLQLQPWLQAVTAQLQAGAALLIDYGYARHECYHAQRAQGSLLCHYRHRAHADPLLLPGIQDITAYVDFTALAAAGVASGLELAGYTTQAHYLLDAGIEQLLAGEMDAAPADFLRQASQVKTLLLPGEMGERFKCLLLARGLNAEVTGFRGRDFRERL